MSWLTIYEPEPGSEQHVTKEGLARHCPVRSLSLRGRVAQLVSGRAGPPDLAIQ